MIRILIILLFTTFSYSQSRTFTGVVSDDSNMPLESSNVIAKPLQENASLKFAIADNKGRYRLELEQAVKYEITVSYIGYVEELFILEANSTTQLYNFKLKPTGEQLNEIIIKHDFKPIIIKKDTMTFDVNSFAKGNERKMKEILERLPGVEVDKNGGVTVQGKKVTTMLVEGKSFFGGGTKLAVENIPADALDKIEVIDHFNEVGFMKQVSDSDELAMNVKLKENKKKFLFGDIEAAAEVGNDDNGFYLAKAALFYYSPKSNFSFIGDLNNIGKSAFTFQDLMRFGGGASRFISGRKSLTNLYSFASDNTDVLRTKSQFAALNFSHDTSPKLSVSGYAIFSKVLTETSMESQNDYLLNNGITFEDKFQKGSSESVLGIANVKLDYSPSAKEKWYYNGQYQASSNDLSSTINSITNLNSSIFETLNSADNASLKQYAEWHKSHNDNHTTTFVANHIYDKSTPQTEWFTDQPFLAGLIPLQSDSSYRIDQIKKVQNNSIDALFKHYWILNNNNHIYTNIGNNFGSSNFDTSERQLLSDGTINNFDAAIFGNSTKYQLNDAFVGLEYKFRIGKWTNKPGVYVHWYNLNTKQESGENTISEVLIEPQWNSDYEFNKAEKISFIYKLTTNFPEVNQLANNFTLQNYNLVFKGNALLQNERFHSANIVYTKSNTFQGIMLNARASYIKKVKNIRNEIILDGIDQFSTPIISDNPETNYAVNGAITKRIKRFSVRLNSNLDWFDYYQTLNNQRTFNQRSNQRIGLLVKTAYKKWPGVSVGYTKGFSQFSGLTTSHYQNDAITSDLDITFLKSWTFRFEYENLKNTNNTNQSNYYDIANSSLRYQKKNSAFGFEFSVNNLFDTRVISNYSFSDYLISETNTFVLPRIMLLSVSYKI